MNSNIKKQILTYAPIVIAILALVLFFAWAPKGQNESEYSAVSDSDGSAEAFLPEADTSSAELKSGWELYIDGKSVAVSEDKAALEKAVADSALIIAVGHNSACSSYSVENSVEYISGEFLPNEFTDDITSAVIPELDVLGIVTEVKSVEVEFETLYRDNVTLKEGTTKVITEGQNGSNKETNLLYYSEEGLVKCENKETTVEALVVHQVVERGVKPASDKTFTSLAMFTAPFNGGISSEYGTRYLMGGTFHSGVDIAGKKAGEYCYGEPILASGDGKVVHAGWNGGYGKLVIIEHPNGMRTYYAHMSEILVKVGDTVSQGEQIGKIGSTGKSQGPHVHFEVRVPDENGYYYNVNPKYYIINYESLLRN